MPRFTALVGEAAMHECMWRCGAGERCCWRIGCEDDAADCHQCSRGAGPLGPHGPLWTCSSHGVRKVSGIRWYPAPHRPYNYTRLYKRSPFRLASGQTHFPSEAPAGSGLPVLMEIGSALESDLEGAVEQIVFGAGERLNGAEVTELGIACDGVRCEEAVAGDLEIFGPLERIAGAP
jgi:hypothetical protein